MDRTPETLLMDVATLLGDMQRTGQLVLDALSMQLDSNLHFATELKRLSDKIDRIQEPAKKLGNHATIAREPKPSRKALQ